MTNVREELDAIRARLDAAEPGPWFTSGRWWLEGVNHYVVDGPKGPMTRNDLAYLYTEADAELVAHAPTDLARLVKAVEAVSTLHAPDDSEPGWCYDCGFAWPCRTFRAVSEALEVDAQHDSHCICAPGHDGDCIYTDGNNTWTRADLGVQGDA